MVAKAKTLHVLGGGQWQLPTIARAKAAGYRVLVTDMYRQRPAYALADAHAVVDITDLQATLAIAREHRIDGILCDTTDVGVPTAAYVAEQLGLPGIGYEVACNFTNKFRMRSLTAAAGLSDVRFRLVTSGAELEAAADEYGFPLVVKPVDNQSSRGVHRIDRREQCAAFFEDAKRCSRSGDVLAEEFLPGIESTVEAVCVDGECTTLGISDKLHFAHRPEVAKRLTFPADFAPATLAEIARLNTAIVRCLGLRTGVTHAEYMVDGARVRLVEIAARGGGSRLYSDIAPHLSGVDAPGVNIEFAMGGRPRVQPTAIRRAANLQFFEFAPGKVRAIHGLEAARQLPGVHEILLEFGIGDVLARPDDDRSRSGLMIVFGEEREAVLQTSRLVEQTVRVELEPTNTA
jgi:biotin carboxylase